MNSIHTCNAANRRSNIRLYPDDWKNLSIPDVAPQQQQPIVALVEQILTAKRANPNGHGKNAAPDDETRHARFPLPNPLPQAGEGANESLREFHVSADITALEAELDHAVAPLYGVTP